MRLQMHGSKRRYLNIILALLAILACVPLLDAGATAAERRLALVIGNGSYKAKPLATAINDAALIAQTLQLAGFDVIGARDLDLGLLRKSVGDLTDKVASTEPGATVFVYFSGYAVQLAGENYLIPIGAEITNLADLPARALSLTELMRALGMLKAKSVLIVLDAARPGPFVLPGQAGGLAWTEPEANMLVAFSAAPGTLARDTAEGYGAYAKALAEMIREGDLTPENLFERVRLRVHDLSRGAQIPWNASKIEAQFRFFERSSGAPSRIDAPGRTAQLRFQPMRALGAQQAYLVALLRDTFDAYADYVADYWQDPIAKRVRALLASRRESVTWRRTCQANEAAAFWTYLERYQHGPHVADAERLLAKMGAATTPPAMFTRMDYDVPPPLPDELEYVERPALMLDDRAFGFEPPPPTPSNFLEPPPQEMLNPPPAAPATAHGLPVLSLPLQAFLRTPPNVGPMPSPSNSAREAWVMRPAIEIPTGPEKQTGSSVIYLPPESNSTSDPADEVQSPVAAEASGRKNLGPRGGNQPATNEITSRLAGSPRAESATPGWLTDVLMARKQSALQWISLADTGVPVAVPLMFAPAAAGMTLQTWRYGIPSSRPNPQTARPVVRARPQTAAAGQTPNLLQQLNGSVPSSTARSAAHVPAATGNPSKPTTNAAGRSLTAADQPSPRRKPVTTPAPPSRAVTTSSGAPTDPQ